MLRRRFTASAIASMILPAAAGTAARPPGPGPSVRRATHEEIRQWLQGRGKSVLTFLGYSAAQYESHAGMLAQAASVLATHAPANVLVNIGATPDGIGGVYPLAKRLGFETMGLVSTQALAAGARWSPAVDHVFLIEDASWGGADAAGVLRPTSAAMVALSDAIVAIGGGAIARDELLAARGLGKPSRFIPAESNHDLARRKARAAGRPAPASFASVLGTTGWMFP